MSVQNAKILIKKVQTDAVFRKEMYQVKGVDGFNKFIEEKELTFDENEFEDAYNMLVLQCQLEKDHDELENVVNLIKLIVADNR